MITNRVDSVVTLLMRGIAPKRVARLHGVTYQAVRAAGLRHGVKRRSQLRRERHREWLEFHEAGFSMAQVAWIVGVPVTTVRSAIDRLRKAVTNG